MLARSLRLLTLVLISLVAASCSDDDECVCDPGVPVPTHLVIVDGNHQSGVVGSRTAAPLTAGVTSSTGLPMAGVQVYFTIPAGDAALTDTLVQTDTNGMAMTFVQFGPTAGPVQVAANAPGLQGSPAVFDLIALAADAAVMVKVAGDEQSGLVGQALSEPVVVQVRDANGNPVQDVSVVFRTDEPFGSLAPASALTDTAGTAASIWTLGTGQGMQYIWAEIEDTGHSLIFTALALPDQPVQLRATSGDGAGGAVGEDVHLQVQATDQYGNGTPDVAVQFSLLAGSGTLSDLADTTGTAGDAETILTLGPGLNQIEASASGLDPVNISARGFTPVALLTTRNLFTGVEVTWEVNTNSGFASYELRRATTAEVGEDDELLATITDEGQTTFTDQTVQVGQDYFYRLFVNFAGGFVLPSNELYVRAGVQVELAANGFQLAHDPTRELVYVSLPTLNSIAMVSTTSFQVVDEVVVGSLPHGIALSLDGSTLYCALNGAGAVAVLDLASQNVTEIDVGTELGDPATWDVIEAHAGEIVVTAGPGSSGFAYVVKIDRNQGDLATRIAGGRIIRASPNLARDPSGDFVYVGEGFSPNSLYKLDMTQPGGPIVLEDDHGDVSGTNRLAVSGDGSRIYLRSGQVLRTGSFNQAGLIGSGVPVLSSDGSLCYVGTGNFTGSQYIETYDTTTFLMVDQVPAPAGVDRMILLEGQGALVLSDDLLYGIPLP